MEYKNTEGAVLLDVRTPQEYRGVCAVKQGTIAALRSLGQLERIVTDKKKAAFVYCYSGSKAVKAVRMLGKMGIFECKKYQLG